MPKKTEIDFLIEQIEMDNLPMEVNYPESCSDWLKNVYIKSRGCKCDLLDIKDAFPELETISDEKMAPVLASAIFKYWCGGERYDKDQRTLQSLKQEFSRGGLKPWWSDDPIDDAGPITYYIFKKFGIKCPPLNSKEEKSEWFNNAFFGVSNSSEKQPEPEPVKKKKKFLGLF